MIMDLQGKVYKFQLCNAMSSCGSAIEVSVYSLIFLDETGVNRRNTIRCGYSMQGKPLVSHQLLFRGDRLSALAFMSINGLLDVRLVRGTTNGDTFCCFVEECLLPQLQPFDGINPHSAAILDNYSIYHVSEAVKMIEEVGAIPHFLPPYSPDFMPIESTFSKVKALLKTNEEKTEDMETTLLEAFATIVKDGYQKVDYTFNSHNIRVNVLSFN